MVEQLIIERRFHYSRLSSNSISTELAMFHVGHVLRYLALSSVTVMSASNSGPTCQLFRRHV